MLIDQLLPSIMNNYLFVKLKRVSLSTIYIKLYYIIIFYINIVTTKYIFASTGKVHFLYMLASSINKVFNLDIKRIKVIYTILSFKF